MTDSDSLKFVIGWGLGGIVASGLMMAALFALQQATPEREIVTERSVNSLDEQTCRRMMETFVEQSRSGAQIIWLWAEESTPRVFGAGNWTKQKVDITAPPRPYAFDPATQTAPPEACSFKQNSLHVVAYEPKDDKGAAFISDRIE